MNHSSSLGKVGQATFGSATHAGLWNGAAASWIDLNPAGATSSVANAISGTTQVGYARFDDGTTWPGVWHGTAASWEPLPFPNYPEDQGSGGWYPWAYAESSSVWTDGNYLYAAGYVARWHYVASVQDPVAVLWWRLISSPLPGDFNNDGAVDAADYVVWRDHLGAATSLPNDATPGVGIGDYDVWKQNFGETPGSGASANGAVPEPATMVLLIVGMLAFIVRRSAVS